MPRAGFELVIPAIERLQIYALDCAVAGIGFTKYRISYISYLGQLNEW